MKTKKNTASLGLIDELQEQLGLGRERIPMPPVRNRARIPVRNRVSTTRKERKRIRAENEARLKAEHDAREMENARRKRTSATEVADKRTQAMLDRDGVVLPPDMTKSERNRMRREMENARQARIAPPVLADKSVSTTFEEDEVTLPAPVPIPLHTSVADRTQSAADMERARQKRVATTPDSEMTPEEAARLKAKLDTIDEDVDKSRYGYLPPTSERPVIKGILGDLFA